MERLVLWHRLVSGTREDERDHAAELAWVKRVVARIAAEGGDTVAAVGGSVVACFDAIDVTTAIDLCLALVAEAERNDDPASAVRLAFGLAMGDVRMDAPIGGKHALHVGAPFDRAQLLANRARVGEIVVDGPTRESCGAFFLFHRIVGSGESTTRGHSIDRTTPRLDACRESLRDLGPLTLPQTTAPALEALTRAATSSGTQVVILRGPAGAGARQTVDQLIASVEPSLVLRMPPASGGHEPLGSLRAALDTTFGGVGGLDALASSLDAASCDALRAIARGEVLALPAAVDAIAALLVASRRGQKKPMIVLDPVTAADTSTLELVGELVQRQGLELLVVGRARGTTRVPAALSRERAVTELVVPSPKQDEARALAERILVRTSDPDIARRVVALAGESPIAVLETIRWLVSVGDIVEGPRGFRFRVGPRVASKVMSLEAIYAERIATLDPDAQRVLEIVAIIPCGFGEELLDDVARADGIDAAAVRDAKAALVMLGLPTDTEALTSAEALRAAVLRGMPPARSGELSRFVAEALARRPRITEGFVTATYAHFLAEGGQNVEAATHFLETASRAAAHHHVRAAIRLAASAVELDPSARTRDASSRILDRLSSRPKRPMARTSSPDLTTLPPPSRDADSSGKLAADAIGALRAGDFDRVERCIDMAIAEGGSLVAAERIRALAHLSRGDKRAAAVSLGRARGFAGEDAAERARNGLLDAWVRIAQGAHREALRSALLALAAARSTADAVGERAALRTAAVCLDLLGREDDARALRTIAA